MDASKLKPVLSVSTTRKLRGYQLGAGNCACSGSDQPMVIGNSQDSNLHTSGLLCITALSRSRMPWAWITAISPAAHSKKVSNGRPLTPVGRWRPLVAFSPCRGGERTAWEIGGKKQRKGSLTKVQRGRPIFRLTHYRPPSCPRACSPLPSPSNAPVSLCDRNKPSKPPAVSSRRPGDQSKPDPILRSSSGLSAWNQE